VDLCIHGAGVGPARPVRGFPGQGWSRRHGGLAVAAGGGRPAKAKRGRAVHQLVVTAGALAGTRITLGEHRSTIGRAEDSTLVITDDYASARHARLVPRDGQWLLEDLGSTNGPISTGTRSPAPPRTPRRADQNGRTALELRP